jgi:alpha-L-arabinofuranosidase
MRSRPYTSTQINHLEATMKKITLFLTLLLFTLNVAAAQDDALTVDVSESLGAISPYVYGASYGPWALVSPEMTPQAAASGVTFLRFPGGNWGDVNDIRENQIDLFVLQARAWNAEPSIATRVDGGSPEKAAELVRYANVEKDYNIRYWTIGNEPTLDEGYDIERFSQEWRAHAEAMLAVDPDLILYGPELHQYPPSDDPNHYLASMRDWIRGFLEVNGDLVDIVSVHRYPFPAGVNTTTTIDDLRGNTQEIDTLLAILRQDIFDVVGHDIPIAITEINSHYSNTGGGEASPDSFYNAIWWADVLGRFIKNKVEVVSYFALYTPPGVGSFGMLSRYEPRPTYYVYLLYQQFGEELVGAASSDPDLSIYAAKRDDGALTLMVVNLGPDEKTKTLEVEGFTPSGEAEVWRFDAEHNSEQIDSVEVADGASLTLPGQSITLYIVESES